MSQTERKAVYAASLDPITNGHLNIIERASTMFDHLYVLVAINAAKKYMFTSEERLEMAKDATKNIPNVTVFISEGIYVVNHAKQLGAQFNVRGIRDAKDFADEEILNSANKKIQPSIETIWIPCDGELRDVSSSFVKMHIDADPEWGKQVIDCVTPFVLNKIFSKSVFSKAKKHFERLLPVLKNEIEAWILFGKLVSSYSEPHRHYHNLEHIINMLDEFELELKAGNIKPENPDAIRLAIWFHDYIYDSLQKVEKKKVIADNEERSAYYYKIETEMFNLPEGFNNLVSRMILSTKHNDTTTDNDSRIVIDLDLAILGKSESKFISYDKKIRKEYEFVPIELYCKKRIEILQYFLNRDSIFLTTFFKHKYEERAISNIESLIFELENGVV